VWLIAIADERVGEQVKLWDPLRTRAIPECLGGDVSRRGAVSSVRTFNFTFSNSSSNCTCVQEEGSERGHAPQAGVTSHGLAVWCSGNALVSINTVALHGARLVLGWVTAFGQVNCLIT